MALLDKIKYGLDLPSWQQLNPALNAHAAGGCICADGRNDISAYDAFFQLASASVLNVHYGPPNGSAFIANPGLSSFGAGSAIVFVPSMTYTGTLSAGSTTTSVVLSTLGFTIPKNGFVLTEGLGFKIRIIDNAGGASGKTIERFIVGNTESTTPTVYVNASFGLTPTTGSAYEIIAGKVFCLGNGATAATQMRYYSIGSGAMTSCTGTGLTIATESSMIALDEQYVPYDRKPGEGFVVGTAQYDNALTAVTTLFDKYCLTATNSASGSITGQASGGDYASVITNEYRNFQIRIVEDTAIPTAVGQRRIIASHTGSGVAPVYTLGSSWSVTPSTNAKFVIEFPNLLLLSTVAASTATYTYNPNAYTVNNGTTLLTANTWSSTYFGARGNAIAAGSMLFGSYGHQPTSSASYTKLTRHSYIYSFRGGGTSLDILDIAGGASGSWTNGATYNSQQTSISTGSCGDYAPTDQQGRWFYFNLNGGNLVYRFDVKYLAMYPWCNLPAQSGTAAVGQRIACVCWNNQQLGLTDKMTKIYALSHLSTNVYKSDVII